MYISSLVLMTLAEERVRGFDRRAFHGDLRALEPGQARPWPARAFAVLSARSRAGARRAGLAAARAHS